MTITAVTMLDLLKNQTLCGIIWACSYYLVMTYFLNLFSPLQATILYQMQKIKIKKIKKKQVLPIFWPLHHF